MLAQGHILLELESPVVYNFIKDELYELDDGFSVPEKM